MDEGQRQNLITVAICSGAILMLACVGWILESQLAEDLDERLGRSLKQDATLVAALVDPSAATDPFARALALDVIVEAHAATGAVSVMLLDPSGQLVESYPTALAEKVYLALDSAAIASAAVLGEPAAGPLRQAGDTYLKSAYAPIVDTFGDVVGVIGIEAPADFFSTLFRVRQALIVLLGLASALIVGLTILVNRFSLRYQASQRAVLRSQHLATVGQMAATMAHEIRNPLAIIKGSSLRIKKKYGDGNEIFDFIPDEVDRLDRLTKWYLDFAGEIGEKRQGTNLADVVMESLNRLRTELETAGVEIVTHMESQKGKCFADHDRLVQVVLNLIINAQQAMPGGGTLSVSVATAGDKVRLEISDTGVGIPPEKIHGVFDPFFTTKTSGSGLGLAVVKKVIEAHDGTVKLDSVLDEGTTVTVEMPRLKS